MLLLVIGRRYSHSSPNVAPLTDIWHSHSIFWLPPTVGACCGAAATAVEVSLRVSSRPGVRGAFSGALLLCRSAAGRETATLSENARPFYCSRLTLGSCVNRSRSNGSRGSQRLENLVDPIGFHNNVQCAVLLQCSGELARRKPLSASVEQLLLSVVVDKAVL